MSNNIEGKVVLITGVSSGLGLVTAPASLRAGAIVVQGASEALKENCASWHGAGGEGSVAWCMIMSGLKLLSAVLRMDAKAFLGVGFSHLAGSP